ncbi:hypothetical protein VP01_1627g3, partial [Puccinia sorghi]
CIFGVVWFLGVDGIIFFGTQILHPYISKVLDIESDGHCGFRVVSYCLGRGQHEHLAVRNELYQHTKERGK